MKYMTFIKELTKKMCTYFTIYIDVECNIRRFIFWSQISRTSRLYYHILKKVLETRHLEEIDYNIKQRWYMTHDDLNLKTKKNFFVTLNKTYFSSLRTDFLIYIIHHANVIGKTFKKYFQKKHTPNRWIWWKNWVQQAIKLKGHILS